MLNIWNFSMRNYQIVNKRPWWWRMTGLTWDEKYAHAIGNKIYSAKADLEEETIVHESIHIRQQKGSILITIWYAIRDMWDKEHWFQAELEAYQEQMDFLLKKYPNHKEQIKQHIINKMCDPIYGFDKQRICELLE